MENEETITISKKEYLQLQDDARLLSCLRNAGVDNWEGWDFALEEYHEGNEDDS